MQMDVINAKKILNFLKTNVLKIVQKDHFNMKMHVFHAHQIAANVNHKINAINVKINITYFKINVWKNVQLNISKINYNVMNVLKIVKSV
jgi:hypothetical protein